MFKLIRKLYQVNLLSPKGIYFFIGSIVIEGVNLLSLLRFTALLYPNRVAIHEVSGTSTYQKLYEDCKKIAFLLKDKYNIREQDRVALLCRNQLAAIQSLFALSRLGVNVYLLNIEMSSEQLNKIIDSKNFDLIIYDEEKSTQLKHIVSDKKLLANHYSLPSINNLLKNADLKNTKLKRYRSGSIVVLSGGTTGEFKSAGRKPSIGNFINPFCALLTKLEINRYKSVYIGTPIYHGYGLAALIVSILIGSETFLLKKYHTEDACSLIKMNNIEIIIIVPLMLQRMLNHDNSALASLKCVVSGSAPLDETLVERTLNQLGNKLYNLYGTSEAGFSIMATPDDLKKNPATIGKKINGVSIRIVDKNNQVVKQGSVGMICIKSRWVMDSQSNKWVPTGDLGYIDEEGYIFLRGRNDNMIVSGGENVYPEELEHVLIRNQFIESAAVIGIPDKEFGQRLKAYVVLKEHSDLNEDKIIAWLSDKVARYQMPAQIRIIDNLPMTSIGKVDKKELYRLL